jgi:O-antigen/teichoic acid export membrane protein
MLHRGQALVGVSDQVLSSGSNFLLLLLIAQSATVSEFGWFAVLFGVVAVALGLTRTALGVPISMEIGRRRSDPSRLISQSSTLALAIGTLAGLVMGSIGLALQDGPATWAFLIALGMPLLALHDLLRFVTVAKNRAGVAVASDGVWFAVILGMWVLSMSQPGRVTGTHGVLGWLIGGVLALVVLACVGMVSRPALHGLSGLIRESRRLHLAGDALVAAGAPALLSALVAVITVPAVTGIWRGATILMSPVNVLLAAVPLVYLPRLTALGDKQALSVCQRLGLGLSGVALLWGLTVFLLPPSLGAALMGETWAGARKIVPIVSLESAAIAMWTTGVTLLRAREDTRRALHWRLGYAGLSLFLGVAAAALWASPPVVAAALAACASATGLSLWWSLRRNYSQMEALGARSSSRSRID